MILRLCDYGKGYVKMSLLSSVTKYPNVQIQNITMLLKKVTKKQKTSASNCNGLTCIRQAI